jgi:hypothetical protein
LLQDTFQLSASLGKIEDPPRVWLIFLLRKERSPTPGLHINPSPPSATSPAKRIKAVKKKPSTAFSNFIQCQDPDIYVFRRVII